MKRALVTGGSGTIGAAICRDLGASGHYVYVHAHQHLEKAQQVVAQIVASGGCAEAVRFDVTDALATGRALNALLDAGAVQILVNNAGCTDDAPLAGMRHAQWTGVIDVVLHGFFNVTQPLLMPMIRARWGRIVNVASAAAIAGNRGQANYAAAKAGLIAAGKSLSLEIARKGVTVNAVAPGIIESPMAEQAFDGVRINDLVPMRRAGTPEEVAATVGFLTSDAASYISGQVLSINGGMM
ncbi:MAG: 3-oxoacyl-ACP reductase FabG [Casimicrobiaceae bacterium]